MTDYKIIQTINGPEDVKKIVYGAAGGTCFGNQRGIV